MMLDKDKLFRQLRLQITLPRLGAPLRFLGCGSPSVVHHLRWMGLCPTEAWSRHSQRERHVEGPSKPSLEVGLTPNCSCCRDGPRTSILDCVFPQAGSRAGVRRILTAEPSLRKSGSSTSLKCLGRLTPSRGWIRC